MKSFKKWSTLICLALVCLLLALAGCGNKQTSSAPETSADTPAATSPKSETTSAPPAAEKITIKIATGKGEGDVKTIAARKMATELEEKSNGQITVEVYPDGQLLKDTDMIEGVPNGTADIGICGLGWWSGKVPEVSILGGMGIFDSADHYWNTCESELFDFLAQKFDANANTRVLAWVYSGMSDCILTRKKPVHTPDDMKGLKIRVPNDAMGSAVKALGASPVVIPYADIYTALQTGVVDGTWGTLGSTYNDNFYDLVSYVSELPLAYSDAFGIIVGNDTWDKWPKNVQDLVQQASAEMYMFSRQYIGEQDKKIWEELKTKSGLTVYFVPENDVPAFAKLVGPGQLESLKTNVPDQSYQDIINIIDKYRSK